MTMTLRIPWRSTQKTLLKTQFICLIPTHNDIPVADSNQIISARPHHLTIELCQLNCAKNHPDSMSAIYLPFPPPIPDPESLSCYSRTPKESSPSWLVDSINTPAPQWHCTVRDFSIKPINLDPWPGMGRLNIQATELFSYKDSISLIPFDAPPPRYSNPIPPN